MRGSMPFRVELERSITMVDARLCITRPLLRGFKIKRSLLGRKIIIVHRGAGTSTISSSRLQMVHERNSKTVDRWFTSVTGTRNATRT